MNLPQQIARHFHDVYYGGNWTSVNLKETLADVSWQQATIKMDSLNTIAALVYHINYYVDAILNVLQNKPLNAHDKYSFNLPPIHSQKDWEDLLNRLWSNANDLIKAIEQLPESKLGETFAEEKYGSYYTNLCGVIEHTHYHLGQIVLIKKLVSQKHDS